MDKKDLAQDKKQLKKQLACMKNSYMAVKSQT
jgi:hypothetical protein